MTNSPDNFTNLEFRIYQKKINEFMISFSNAQTEKNSWKKIVKQIGENIG